MADKSQLDDDDFLALVRQERSQSIGFDNDDELAANREKALQYLKGEMTDLTSLPNRSAAVSTDFADAVETVMPDLMEIFTGGDDVATFRPQGAEDVEAAAQETDYVNHIIFNENDGWLTLHTIIKDALTVKIGVAKVWGERYAERCEQELTGQTAASMELAQERGAQIVNVVATDPDPITGEPLFNCTAVTYKPQGRTRIKAVPPEDFTVARDTVVIRDAVYCAMRSRPRAQELIADGYDPDDVAVLPPFGSNITDGVEVARDTAGEHSSALRAVQTDGNLHQVEIIEHYLRVDADGDGYPELWCIVTDGAETMVLKRERADRIPFSVSTPYLVAHRLFGQSLFDKLEEIQRIRTTLLRMLLDSGYFALNQRYEVAQGQGQANDDTLNDLLNNTPGFPVRSQSGSAVRALGGGRLDFDVAGAMEFMATVAEQRSGVVRNAQGLNPDTLHDTAKGAMALMTAAQKRVRMIARVFAETGIKDLFLLVHAVTRSTATAGAVTKLRNKWVPVDPTQWGARSDMTIEVGVGSGGREMELAALRMVMDAQEKLIQLQGGQANGPFITSTNVYNTAKRLAERSGLKGTDLYFSDPTQATQAPAEEPPPDPELIKIERDMELRRYEIDKKLELEERQQAREFELRREQLVMEARMRAFGVEGAGGSDIRLGGEPG